MITLPRLSRNESHMQPFKKYILKEKGIRFQILLTKIRIHWSNGVKMYESAREAAGDMKERGYKVDVPGGDTDPTGGGRMRGAMEWQRVRGKE